MLKDRQKVKRIIKLLRYAAKNECVIRFENDRNLPDVLAIKGGHKYMVFNAAYLYRNKRKVEREI